MYPPFGGLKVEISIHAPAKGATLKSGSSNAREIYFNPRSREGSDLSASLPACASTAFQSTLPRRERPPRSWLHAPAIDFNPRSREGSDLVTSLYGYVRSISIHAPAKGATPVLPALRQRTGISIHAPAKGATLDSSIIASMQGFQSTLPRRERPVRFIPYTS